jgi:hypothetical protein
MYAGYQSEPWSRMKGWFMVGADLICDGGELLKPLKPYTF